MLDSTEIINRIRLLGTDNIGAISFYKLLGRYHSASNALEHLPPQYVPPSFGQAEQSFLQAQKQGITLLHFDSPTYPKNLKQLRDAPPLLYVLGNSDLLNASPAVSVVGSRNASVNGRKLASRIAFELSEQNVMVISGMARGIDSSAHKGAMYANNQQGRTIAVLGTGVDIPYPKENTALYQQIITQGAVISEFPLGTTPQAQNFPRRNRLVSALSNGTLVIEAGLSSGSLITARLALEQGRDVFAVPGSPIDSRSSGTNKLIKDGAFLVETAEDILSHLSFSANRQIPAPCPTPETELFDIPLDKAPNNVDISTEQTAQSLLDCLNYDGVYVDELIRLTGLDSTELAAQLLDLELDNRIERLPGNKIALLK